jgi:hypothetical protein
MISVTCAQCETPYLTYPSKVGSTSYCSRKCQVEARANTAGRFWKRVAVGGPDDCWEWQGKRDVKDGYGCVSWKGKEIRAHRVALSLTDGDWANPFLVCHDCDNPPCCNPAHLWRGTPLDNMLDKKAKGRGRHNTNVGEGRKNGHKLTEKQVLEIRASLLSGRQLSKKYGVARNYIFAIKKRLTWRHLP